jgi:hypothetical protein
MMETTDCSIEANGAGDYAPASGGMTIPDGPGCPEER